MSSGLYVLSHILIIFLATEFFYLVPSAPGGGASSTLPKGAQI